MAASNASIRSLETVWKHRKRPVEHDAHHFPVAGQIFAWEASAIRPGRRAGPLRALSRADWQGDRPSWRSVGSFSSTWRAILPSVLLPASP